MNNVKSTNGSSSDDFHNHLISYHLAGLLSQEYDRVNYKTINDSRAKNQPDAKEVVFDLDVLEGYLQYVRARSSEMGVKNPKMRIVFGQYPKDKPIDPRQDAKYLGYQTVYLMPDFGDTTSLGTDGKGDADGLNFGGLRPPY